MRPADERLAQILDALQDLAAGELDRRLDISPAHDELDALAHAANVIGGELAFTTERLTRARDAAEQASKAKNLFLRNISHELRTPLSAILGIAELLQTPGLDDARRDALYARIVANVRVQLELLDDLLDLSQVESGKLALDPRQLDVHRLIAEVIESLEPSAETKGNTLTLAPDGADLRVIADPRRTRQILANLIGNAIKFTSHGHIAVRTVRQGTSVAIEVEDTGIGVDPAHVDRLFEQFMQADPSIARRFGGSGLGLALSRRLAREMGGDITIVSSSSGRGTTFRLTLPQPHAEADAPRAGARAAPAAPPALDGVCVLLVDDHEDIRTPVAMLLASRGATVYEAASGGEAIELGTRAEIALILMDVRMPDIDGLEATRRLRALGVRTPIVALTADVLVDDQDAYADAGCTTQFAKPIDIDRLTALIHGLARTPDDAA